MKYILPPSIEYDTETMDLDTSLLCDESRKYLIKLLNIKPNLDLPESVNLKTFLHTNNGDGTKEICAICQKEKEILDNLAIFQNKDKEKNECLRLEMSVKHHRSQKKKHLERYQQAQNKFKKLKNWTFSALIATSILLFGTAILCFLVPPFAESFLAGGGWLVVLLTIPNAALISASCVTSRQLDKLRAEIDKTSDILDSIILKLKANENSNYSKIKQIPDNISTSLLLNQTSETSRTETSTYKIGFGRLLTTATIHRTQETDKDLTELLDQSEAQRVHSHTP